MRRDHLDIPPERSLGGLERWVVRNDCSFLTALTEAEQGRPIVLWVELKRHPSLALGKDDLWRAESSSLSGGIEIPSAFCQTFLDLPLIWHSINSRPKKPLQRGDLSEASENQDKYCPLV